MVSLANTTFTYDNTLVRDIEVKTRNDSKTGKEIVDHILLKGEEVQVSQRFWTSLFARFGINKSFFKYFQHPEVFGRISDVEPNDNLRVCVERSSAGARVLAVSNPKKPLVSHEELITMLETAGHEDLTYADGIIESTHRPRVGATEFDIAGDRFSNRFVLATPVDGYGLPNVYLSLLRQVCSNGVVAMSKAFRSQVALGKGDDNTAFALVRVLDQFSNEEGYAALRERLESAANSWLSVYESMQLYKMLVKLHGDTGGGNGPVINVRNPSFAESPYFHELLANGGSRPMGEDDTVVGSRILTAFHSMTGDTSRLYGLANLDALSSKRQRTLPVKATVYDMINFATEVATHHCDAYAARKINGWIGNMLVQEYDMEGTCEKFGDFADFHITSKIGVGITGSENSSVAEAFSPSMN
jgi:hypothetical protein